MTRSLIAGDHAVVRLLYAEDDPHDADLTRRRLERDGTAFDLEIATTGKKCLELLRSCQYDLLLLDHRLLDMNGLDVLRVLRSEGLRVPVVMVTGVGDEKLAVHALNAGASDYVPKKGDYLESLPSVIRRVIEESGRTERRIGAPLQRYRILYIEHNPEDVVLTLRQLGEEAPHLDIESAVTGEAGFARLMQEPPVDLVLCDLKMRDRSGLEVLHQARQMGVAVPFILVTGQGDEETAVAALKLGAYDYIIKREGYLTQLGQTIGRALVRFELEQTNQRLRKEITERKRAEEKLHALALRLQSVREEEATRISREIHDESGQNLTALKMDLAWLRKELAGRGAASDSAALVEQLDAMTSLVDQTVAAVQRISEDLRPGALDQLGLAAAVEAKVEEFQKRSGISCLLERRLEGIEIDPGLATTAYRVLQELLTNVARHAEASKVDVLLEEVDGELVLEVKDDGRGITAPEMADPRSLGLAGIRERVSLAGGRFDLEGAAGRGTRATARLPLRSRRSS